MILDDHPADLNDLDHPALWTRRITEAVLADARTGMNDDIVADQRTEDAGTSRYRAIPADPNLRPDHRAGRDPRTAADLRTGADDRRRLYLDPRLEAGRRIDESSRRYAAQAGVVRGTQRLPMQQRTGKSECRVRLLGQENGNAARYDRCDRLVADDRGCLAALQLIAALARQHVADIAGLGAINRCHPMDGMIGHARIGKFRPNPIREVTQANPLMGRKKPVLFHGHSRTISWQFWTALIRTTN